MFSSSSSISGVINFDKVRVKGETAHVTMTLPFAALSMLQDFLGSAAALSSFVSTKAVHNKALSRQKDAEAAPDREKEYRVFVEKVMESYRKHSGPGVTFRAAVLLTKDELVSRGQEITCGMIEIIVKDEAKKIRRPYSK